jgi:hypothetical protein
MRAHRAEMSKGYGARFKELREPNRFRRRLPHMSQTALGQLMSIDRDETPEISCNPRNQLRAKRAIMEVQTSYGPLGQVLDLEPAPPFRGTQHVQVALPQPMLQLAYQGGGGFAAFLQRTHERNPSSYERPWNVIVYGDEVDPGMALAAVHNRKIWMFYWSLREFGPLALSDEDFWFTIAAKRACDMPRISNGISNVCRTMCKAIWLGDNDDPRVVGINLFDQFDGSPITIYATLGGFLMDGAAHKELWGVKGYNGLRLCILCLNLFSRASRINEEDGTEGICCSITDPDQLILATRNQIYATVDRLAAKRLTDTPHVFEVREKAVGFNHMPDGILLEPALRDLVDPTEHFIIDSQHTLFIDGVANVCAYLVLEALFQDEALGGRWTGVFAAVGVFLGEWCWPAQGKTKGHNIADIFSSRRVDAWRKAEHIKCTAGEMRSMYPVLAYWFARFTHGKCPLQIRAYLLMTDMIDAILGVPYGHVSKAEVRSRVRVFLLACRAAGWEDYMKPKFHWLAHVLGELTCWTLERKHKVPKSYAIEHRSTENYDWAVLSEVVCEHLSVLEQPDFGSLVVGCIGKVVAAPATLCGIVQDALGLHDVPSSHFVTNRTARFGAAGSCTIRDVVMMQCDGEHYACGEVWAHIQLGDHCCTLVSRWDLESWDDDGGLARFRTRDAPELWETSDIVGVCTYRRYANVAVVLIPVYLM